jgi:hypothetical protein
VRRNLAHQLVQELLGFDDGHKKKIIEESVRTSSVDFHSEGSGLWLGRFVLRRSRQSGSCCGRTIVDATFCSIAIFKSNATCRPDVYSPVLEDGSCPQKHLYKKHRDEERVFKKHFDQEKE